MIKFKVTEILKVQVDWTTIVENLETNDLFNVNMFQIIPKKPTYVQLNQFMTKADEMNAVTTKRGKGLVPSQLRYPTTTH